MAKVTSVTKCVLTELTDYLKKKMALGSVSHQWPDPNVQLKYPALTVFSGNPRLTPQPATVFARGKVVGNKGDIFWHVGDYDWKLQLDLWTDSKEARHQLYESLFRAINSMLPITGLSLKLTDYHDVFCRYDLNAIEYIDGEESAQRKEWRLKAEILAKCEAIIVSKEDLITKGEIVLDDHQAEEETTTFTL